MKKLMLIAALGGWVATSLATVFAESINGERNIHFRATSTDAWRAATAARMSMIVFRVDPFGNVNADWHLQSPTFQKTMR